MTSSSGGTHTERREVVIVGAGPAGAVAGLLLARAGHDVLLLERLSLPRRKPCGDCVSAGSTQVFERLGLLPAIDALAPARLRGWRIIAPDGSSFTALFEAIAQSNQHGAYALAVARDRLDAALLHAAIAAGVEVRTGARVTDVACDEQGTMVYLHGCDRPMHARLLIGADGLRSIVARATGAVRRSPRLRKLSLSTHAAPFRDTDGLGEMHLARGACMGIAPVTAAGDACNVTLVVKSDMASIANVHAPSVHGRHASRSARLDAFVDDWRQRFPLLATGAPVGPLAGEEWLASGPFDMAVRHVTHDGVALVGDAAGYFDPLTGQGIHQAIAGAEALATVAALALRQPGPVRRGRLAGWADAHAALTLGTRRVQRLIDAVLARPPLANAAIRALARSDVARNALLGVTGDLRSPASLLHPGLATATLHSLLRAS